MGDGEGWRVVMANFLISCHDGLLMGNYPSTLSIVCVCIYICIYMYMYIFVYMYI